MSQPTRDKLVETAAALFRQKGYAGVGVAEILAASGVPKGSLYHHFPKGKADLAAAALRWSSAGMIRIIDDSFAQAASFEDGVATLCHKIAKFFDISDHKDGCPVSAVLFHSSDDGDFSALTAEIFEDWVMATARYGEQFGLTPDAARHRSETLLLAIEGGWIMARAQRSAEIIRSIPGRLN